MDDCTCEWGSTIVDPQCPDHGGRTESELILMALRVFDDENQYGTHSSAFKRVLDAARKMAEAQEIIRSHQRELNRDLRGALGRGKLSPWERDIESLLSICDALLDPSEDQEDAEPIHHEPSPQDLIAWPDEDVETVPNPLRRRLGATEDMDDQVIGEGVIFEAARRVADLNIEAARESVDMPGVMLLLWRIMELMGVPVSEFPHKDRTGFAMMIRDSIVNKKLFDAALGTDTEAIDPRPADPPPSPPGRRQG